MVTYQWSDALARRMFSAGGFAWLAFRVGLSTLSDLTEFIPSNDLASVGEARVENCPGYIRRAIGAWNVAPDGQGYPVATGTLAAGWTNTGNADWQRIYAVFCCAVLVNTNRLFGVWPLNASVILAPGDTLTVPDISFRWRPGV